MEPSAKHPKMVREEVFPGMALSLNPDWEHLRCILRIQRHPPAGTAFIEGKSMIHTKHIKKTIESE